MDVYGAVSEQVLDQAQAAGLLSGDELTAIPELVGMLTNLTTEMANDLVQYHLRQQINIQVPIWQVATFYAWTKGVEAAYRYHQAPSEPVTVNYRSDDLFQGLVGAQVPRWLQAYINSMGHTVVGVLTAMLPWVQEHLDAIITTDDGLQTCLQSSLFHMALIGVTCGQQRMRAGAMSTKDELF